MLWKSKRTALSPGEKMRCVDLVINITARQLNNCYTYAVPEHLLDQAALGKRALVDFAGQKVEGFIVSAPHECPAGETKPLLKILDAEPCFDTHLLQLAHWMSEYYFTPLARVLNLMLPRGLHKSAHKIILPNFGPQDLQVWVAEGQQVDQPLLEALLEKGELSLKKALEYVDDQELLDYARQGKIIISGTYQSARLPKEGYIYTLGKFIPEHDLPALRKRAPQQAEIMQLLLSSYEVAREHLEKSFPADSIKALLKKGYVVMQRQAVALSPAEVELSPEQRLAVTQVEKALDQCQSAELLLYGITGSGKTDVYLQAAEFTLASGKGVIILVPEIALTRQLVEIFTARIGGIAVLHSGMSENERYDEWRRIKRGEARLVLGARSAVFAPVSELGLIIIDEEQEGTFKQEELPRYHARDVARKRTRLESAVLLCGSATPAIETYFRAQEGRTKLLVLRARVGGAKLPDIYIDDLRQSLRGSSQRLISTTLQDKIRENLSRGEQTILFINRRGYAPLTICRECGATVSCPACSVGMTFHRDIGRNICHYCNRQLAAEVCLHCGSKHLQMIGSGTQRVEEEIRNLFPEARLERLDMDSSRKKGAQKSILQRMKDGQIDILIGTQMVAKGLDFPNVSLVGIIDADAILNLPDFRGGERCFQLLVQAAGRAGRGDKPGEVVIQTFNPDHPVIKMAAAQDYPGFYGYEIQLRQALNYPPFTQILRIVFSGDNDEQARSAAEGISGFIERIIDASEEDVNVLGPAPCPIHKIRNRFRYQMLVKCQSLELLRSIACYILSQGQPKHVKMDLDLNPVTTV